MASVEPQPTADESDVIVLDDSFEKSATDMSTDIHVAGPTTDENPDTESTVMEVDEVDSANIPPALTSQTVEAVITPAIETPMEIQDQPALTEDASNDVNHTEKSTSETVETVDLTSTSTPIEARMEMQIQSVSTDEKAGDTEQSAGACEELCIIPDTDRVITQAEKEAAAFVTPVRDATEVVETPISEQSLQQAQEPAPDKYVVTHCSEETINTCEQCCLPRKSKFKVTHDGKTLFICDDSCLACYKTIMGSDKIITLEENLQGNQAAVSATTTEKGQFSRKCVDCNAPIVSDDKSVLSWETLEFCNDLCLAKYQKRIGATCAKCQTQVQDTCMGKYCVRFGYNIRQFCSSSCLEQYKKGLKVCSYCQKEMCEEGFLAPVTDKSLFKDFCSKECLDKYKALSNTSETPVFDGTCSVCFKAQPTIEFEHGNKQNLFCSEPCFVAFKFVNNISPGKCDMCHKYFDNVVITEYTMYYDDAQRSFCSKGCQNVYIIANRKIVPCSWCKVKKYNFDMIKRHSHLGTSFLVCSLNCLSHQLTSLNDDSSNCINCDQCHKRKQPLYHLTMSDGTLRHFCSYSCVLGFQNKFPKVPVLLNDQEGGCIPIPTSGPKRFIPVTTSNTGEVPTIPIITSVQSLANLNGPTSPFNKKRAKQNGVVAHHVNSTPQTIVKTQIRQQVIIRPQLPVAQRNMATMCKVTMITKGTSCKAIITANKAVQTDEIKEKIIIIPIPFPIYVPLPMRMYSQPFPVPFPFPLPIPIPIFIPTPRNSAKGILKEIKKIQAKMPSDPLEAELLMMAEMVAGDKRDDPTDSESDGEEHPPEVVEERPYTPEPAEANSSFGEEMLQMAIKMAAELDEPAVDLEGALAVNTVTAPSKTENTAIIENSVSQESIHTERRASRGRGARGSRGGRRHTRRSISQPEVSLLGTEEPQLPPEPLEKPDANMCLKYTFGVNAWKQWVTTKNAELEQSSSRAKLFKPEILQLTADELNYSLCLFVKEVRKPNGQEYAPDTIYYLCLGIQQYLYENNRIDNIFCDAYYEKFTDCLDEVARKFSVLYNDSHYIITRVEEEHLWESKQLGAHSPHVLLSTLMFFNTKHFNLTSVEDHMQLSFSHIMKHWKRNVSHSGLQKSAGSRNVLLRFYPPQTNADGSATRKKKVYEQQENEDNPLRCPVKLYEFYLSKCPESVKSRNDVFYLLPERSCVPDSPVWYSTIALPKEALEKMLHRVKMVKEINVALLTT